jgi:hypothetical protein
MESLAGDSAEVARGKSLPAGELLVVQEFAVNMWYRFMVFASAVWAPVLVLSVALGASQSVRLVIGSVYGAFGCAAGVGAAQMFTLNLRTEGTRKYLRKAVLGAEERPLDSTASGAPRQSDFWIGTAVAVVGFAVILSMGLAAHSASS